MTLRRTVILSLFLTPVFLFSAACSNSEAEMAIDVSNDAAILAKFIQLDPKPIAVKWSVIEKGKDEIFGPSDSSLFAVLIYSENDFAAVSARLANGEKPTAAQLDKLPQWLADEAGISGFKTNTGYDFTGKALSAEPYLSSPYSDGFAVVFDSSKSVLVYGFSR
ncbi:hypothetical protein HB779_05500 [Phyllobacterium sp. 628]|uniref:hypothetical protein n=1 Tax=Phyllobacterium sp. 628 TaxID=2718938 RepID=UPI0016622469|nr:hypothetical protein [Phyllobacterium sp. 628]QND51415.1 hypothetical protein HB779_05500 [Phyllobacterium sp. 628]